MLHIWPKKIYNYFVHEWLLVLAPIRQGWQWPYQTSKGQTIEQGGGQLCSIILCLWGKANTFIFWIFFFFFSFLCHIIQSLGCPPRGRDYLSFGLSLFVSFFSFGCRKTSFLLTCLISGFLNFFSWYFFPQCIISKFQNNILAPLN
jgi:hypothetical protein